MKINKTKKSLIKILSSFLCVLIIVSIFTAKTVVFGKIKNSTGELNNLIVFISFEDDESYVNGDYISLFDDMYNGKGASVKNYFNEISSNKLKVKGHFLTEQKKIEQKNSISVKLKRSRNYYLPQKFNGGQNTNFENSYDNNYYNGYGEKVERFEESAKKHADGFLRENLMIREVIKRLRECGLENKFKNINIDNNKDGEIDNLTFIIAGDVIFSYKTEKDSLNSAVKEYNIWGEILWPHMTSLMNIDKELLEKNFFMTEDIYSEYKNQLKDFTAEKDVNFCGKRLYAYNVLSGGYLFDKNNKKETIGNTGVICHELLHALGLMDYYSYESDKRGYESVGKFDIMASTTRNPQYLSGYLRIKMNWLTEKDFIIATKSKKYTLSPVNTGARYKGLIIKLKNSDNVFFIETRSNKIGFFDKDIGTKNGDTGIICYRVSESDGIKNGIYYGNMFGRDEMYIFRKNNFKKADSGLLTKINNCYGNRNLSEEINIISYQENNGNDGKNTGIEINNVTVNKDNSVSFNLILPENII